jgi:hypothetical protein
MVSKDERRLFIFYEAFLNCNSWNSYTSMKSLWNYRCIASTKFDIKLEEALREKCHVPYTSPVHCDSCHCTNFKPKESLLPSVFCTIDVCYLCEVCSRGNDYEAYCHLGCDNYVFWLILTDILEEPAASIFRAEALFCPLIVLLGNSPMNGLIFFTLPLFQFFTQSLGQGPSFPCICTNWTYSSTLKMEASGFSEMSVIIY